MSYSGITLFLILACKKNRLGEEEVILPNNQIIIYNTQDGETKVEKCRNKNI